MSSAPVRAAPSRAFCNVRWSIKMRPPSMARATMPKMATDATAKITSTWPRSRRRRMLSSISELRLHTRGRPDVDGPNQGSDHRRRGVEAVDDRNFDELWQGAEVRPVDEDVCLTDRRLVARCQRRRGRAGAATHGLRERDGLSVGLNRHHANDLRVGEARTLAGVGGPLSRRAPCEAGGCHIVEAGSPEVEQADQHHEKHRHEEGEFDHGLTGAAGSDSVHDHLQYQVSIVVEARNVIVPPVTAVIRNVSGVKLAVAVTVTGARAGTRAGGLADVLAAGEKVRVPVAQLTVT